MTSHLSVLPAEPPKLVVNQHVATPLSVRDRFLAILAGDVPDCLPLMVGDGTAIAKDKVLDTFAGDIGWQRWVHPFQLQTPNCPRSIETLAQQDDAISRITIETRGGLLVQDRRLEHGAPGPILRHYVSEPHHYEALLRLLQDVQVVPLPETVPQAEQELGDYGVVHCLLPRTPYQQLLGEWVDPETLNWHLLEPDCLVHACVEEMIRIQLELFDLVAGIDLPYAVFPDNLHGPEIGRTFFKKYCLPLYNELAARLAEQEALVFVRANGELKQLWYDIEDSYVGGIDSLDASRDTRVSEAVSMWHDRVIGLTLDESTFLKPGKVVYQKTRQLLDEAGPALNIFLQVSDPLPPGRWRPSFEAMVRAMHDHVQEQPW